MAESDQNNPAQLTRIAVRGFKSLGNVSVQVKPLTILAGANSSGKSSLLQPLLLIKQTIESSFDTAGGLLLNGPNVKLGHPRGLLTRTKDRERSRFSVTLEGAGISDTTISYSLGEEFGLELRSQVFTGPNNVKGTLTPETSWSSFMNTKAAMGLPESYRSYDPGAVVTVVEPSAVKFRFFDSEGRVEFFIGLGIPAELIATQLIHLPGLRGQPERTYPRTSRQGPYKGTFEPYVASIISEWQSNDDERLGTLGKYLRLLGLTRSISTHLKDASEMELLVGRLPARSRRKDDFVNIADVGFGVSQVLPILVALLEAESDQTVFVEQPELHLHPRPQFFLGRILAEAASRGVRLIVETHSSILLLAIQTLVASGKLDENDVALHWFERNNQGRTKVTSAELDDNGAFGDWPEDFGNIELMAQDAFLDAASRRMISQIDG